MSNSRSERRRQTRGVSAPPPKRDPMTVVYFSAGVLVVVIVAIFATMNWMQQRQIAQAYATPTPAPSTAAAASKPIQLSDGETLGKPTFTLFKGGLPDTPTGGQGQPIDGITCGGMEYSTLHTHTHLAIFYHGAQVAVPKLVGAAPLPPQGCLYWIHTHSQDGIIHVESPVLAPEGSSGFALGMFFDIWGQQLTRNNVAGLKGPVIAYVNGTQYDGDLRLIPLRSHQQIVLEVGTPTVPPPNYTFPPND